jgi:putative nucleotidyltransferase with HDIG domain
MRRILFVDDQEEILNLHRESFKKYAGQVETLFALGGRAALDMAKTTPVDVVVADMHMPDMDGPTLLRAIKEEHPDIVRIMSCAQYEMDSTFFALLTVHQVLGKPVDPETLINVVERTCRLRELLTDSLRKKIGAVGQLPPAPTVYLELTSAMKSEASNRKIARIIEKDPPMAAKTLQLVNSACFGLLRQITTLDNAIAYLGMDLIRDLSLTVHIFTALEKTAVRSGFSFELEQEHSLLTAKLAKRLMSNSRQSQNAFTAALLHDIGKLVLAVCIPEKFKKVQQTCKASGRSAHEVEAEMLGLTHAEVGAYLLGLWGLPYPIVEAVAYHHNPGAALEQTFDIPTAVSLANAFVEEATRSRPITITEHLRTLGVIEKLPAWTEIAREELQSAPVDTAVK